MNFSQVFTSLKTEFVKKWPDSYDFFTVSITGHIFPVNEIDEMHSC